MSTTKGTADLLDAWAGLDTPARLVVVGDGAVEETRRRAAEPDLAGTVDVRGWAQRDAVAALLAESDVLVLPSWAEGQPMIVLEAMSAGVVVLATAVGGVPELVEDGVTGLLVPPRDSTALRAGIERLLADAPARARMGAAGRERVREHHDAERLAGRLTALYDDLLAGRAARGRNVGVLDIGGQEPRAGRRFVHDAATSHSARSPADTAPPGVDTPERSATRGRIAR